MTLQLGPVDLAVLFLYFASMIGIGLYVSRRNTGTDQYFLGGRSFSGVVVGISLIGSLISSVTFIAAPADAFKTTWIRFLPNLAFPLVAVIAAVFFIPFFRRGTISSAYGYLRARFGASLSAYAAVLFLFSQLFRISMILYLLSVLVQSILGLDFLVSLLLTGGITAFYTVKGGYAAVVWTDVIQTILLLLGALLCVFVAVGHVPGGFGQVLREGIESHRLSFWDAGPDGTLHPLPEGLSLLHKTVMMLVLVGFVQFLTGMLDQATVQRWVSARSAADARKGVLILGFGCVPIWGTFKLLGTTLFVYFSHHPAPIPTEILAGARKAEQIVPYFIVTHLPRGIAGLVLAGAFASAMSAVSAGINAASMVWVRDLYGTFLAPRRSDKHYVRVGFATSFLISVLMIGGGYLIYLSKAVTLLDLWLEITAFLFAGIPAVFLLGMFTRRAGSGAVWCGLAVSIAFVGWVTAGRLGALPAAWRLPIEVYYTAIVGNALVLAVGLFAAWLRPAAPRPLENLTVWDQTSRPLE